jgi:hypothetical protein
MRKATRRSTPEDELIRKLATRFRVGDTLHYTVADGWDRTRRDSLGDLAAAKLFVENPNLIDDPDADALRAEARKHHLFGTPI